MANKTAKHKSPEAENQSLFRQVLAATVRHVKSLYKPFEKGDSAFDKFKKVAQGVLSTLLLIMVSPVVLFILLVTLLIAL